MARSRKVRRRQFEANIISPSSLMSEYLTDAFAKDLPAIVAILFSFPTIIVRAGCYREHVQMFYPRERCARYATGRPRLTLLRW